jgi:hypothetical protein
VSGPQTTGPALAAAKTATRRDWPGHRARSAKSSLAPHSVECSPNADHLLPGIIMKAVRQLLQKSEVASVRIFGETLNAKRSTIRITSVALPKSPMSLARGERRYGVSSGCGRQPSDSKFDLTVGELAPIFDNGRVATGWTFVEELAGLSPSLLHRQSEIFVWQAVIAAFALVAKLARPIRDAVRSSH